MSASSVEHYLTDYRVADVIGHGSFATVYLGYNNNEEKVAIKAINLQRLNRKLAENLSTEIAIMKDIRHPHVVRLIEIQKTKTFIYLIMEYCSGGDLAGLLKREKLLPEKTVKTIIRQLASALEALRIRNVIHRDLKPHNLLLASEGGQTIIKVADFGFARSMMPSDLAQTLCGSPLYMAPEILRYEKYDAKADLWSVGAITYEMLYGRPPYKAQNHIQLQQLIDRSPPPKLELYAECSLDDGKVIRYEISLECRSFLRGLLKRNPIERISFEEFFSHSYLELAGGSFEKLSQNDPKYSMPIRRTGQSESFKSSGRTYYYRQSSSQQLAEAAQEIPGTQSLVSLGSSLTSIPPFARFSTKFGTPPSRASGSFKSCIFIITMVTMINGLACSVDATIPTASRHVKFMSENEILDKLDVSSPLLSEKLLFIITLYDLAYERDHELEGPFATSQTTTHELVQLYVLGVTFILKVVDELESSGKLYKSDANLLRWILEKLDFAWERIEFFESIRLSHKVDDSSCPDGHCSCIIPSIYAYSIRVARDGGLQELLGNPTAAKVLYARSLCILNSLISFKEIQDSNLEHVKSCKNFPSHSLKLLDRENISQRLIMLN